MLIKLLGITLLSSQLVFATAIPQGCPHTRDCSSDKNCKLYGSKHNCHSLCTKRTIKNGKNSIDCPQQCLCDPKEPITIFGINIPRT